MIKQTVFKNRNIKVELNDVNVVVTIKDDVTLFQHKREFDRNVILDFLRFYDLVTPHIEQITEYDMCLRLAPAVWFLIGEQK